MPRIRHERVRELLKRELSEIIRREISIEEGGVISVGEVILSPDLKFAKVFVSIIGSPEQQKRGMNRLQSERARMQALVAEGVILKYTPRLRFERDDARERGNRVLDIIEELERENNAE